MSLNERLPSIACKAPQTWQASLVRIFLQVLSTPSKKHWLPLPAILSAGPKHGWRCKCSFSQLLHNVRGRTYGSFKKCGPYSRRGIPRFYQTQTQVFFFFKAGPPLEAILVIFGRRALIFFLFESSWKKIKNDATFVRMRSGDHLGDAKMSKKGTSAPSNLTFLIIVIDTNGFADWKKKGWSTKVWFRFFNFCLGT